MFERNKVDNSREMGGIGVEITLDDGRTLTGKLAVPVSGTLADLLNGPAAFVELEPYIGERLFLAKSGLRTIKPLAPQRVAGLPARLRDVDAFDPWQTLGLASGDGFEKAKAAYHRAAMTYHPDRYAAAELPAEVRDYLAAMARRINSAYAILEAAHAAGVRNAEARTQPIYASGQR